MKKFLRNFFSGYFLVLLMLLIEAGVLLFIQFDMNDLVSRLLGNSASSESMKLIIAATY